MTNERPTMVIIGCGPTGMFFMHAVNLRRQKMEEEGDVNGLAKLPKITCFERCSQPGGVWRSAAEAQSNAIRRNQNRCSSISTSKVETWNVEEAPPQKDATEDATNMYEGLWTNGHALLLEMFDYTFDDHFKRPVLSFMPRAALLDYFLARVTRNNPNFFEDTTLFETNVDKVTYDENIKKFIVTSTHLVTGQQSVGYYDKCLWGAGTNGKRKVPKSLESILTEGNYQGRIMHSSEAGNCLDEFKGKRVLFVGDSSSAQDLALMGCKLGVEHMYVFSRQGRGDCCDCSSWPYNKVEVLYDQELTAVIQNGKGLRFEESWFNASSGRYEREREGKVNNLENVDAVIFCTGYHPNFDMLDVSLFNEDDSFSQLRMPKNWRMKENALSSELGHVKPHKHLDLNRSFFGMERMHYYGLDMSNPNLMYSPSTFDVPIVKIDIRAWFFLGCILGEIEIPTRKEMINDHRESIMEEMDDIGHRSELDPNYRIELEELEDQDDHWFNDSEDERVEAFNDQYYLDDVMGIAEMMEKSLYPVSFLTPEGKLNEKGRKFMEIYRTSEVEPYRSTGNDPCESEWMTFRDYHCEKYVSIYTGSKVLPMKQHWIDLDESDLSNVF